MLFPGSLPDTHAQLAEVPEGTASEMKPTTRGTLAAVLTCMAAAATGAAAASPAAAVPVPVPLEGAETALGVELPRIGAEIPAPKPGSPEGPRYVEGRLLPERALPQLPVSGGLPGADLRAPLPRLLADGFDHLDVSAPASDLRALAPGLDVDAPLTAPRPLRPARPEAARGRRAGPGPADGAGREPGDGPRAVGTHRARAAGSGPAFCPGRDGDRPGCRAVTPVRQPNRRRSTGWSSAARRRER
ncbi:hypothetical protein GCM10020295_53740 [Streptomyces cinereospinus]